MNMLERYSRNDIIYEMPPQDWWQGWLVGNGSGAATVWNPENCLSFQLGHTDLMDRSIELSTDGRGIPNVRHNLRGNLSVHGVPMFDPLYIKKYYARCELGTATVRMNGTSEFGSFSTTFFYCKNPDVFVLRYQEDSKDALVRSFELEKLGSRFFSRIWSGTALDTSMGVGTTQFASQGDIIEVRHEKGDFVMADIVSIQSNTEYQDTSCSHSLERTFKQTQHFVLELRVCLGQGKDVKECVLAAQYAFEECQQYSFEQLCAQQEHTRTKQLPNTFVCLPKDSYYENLWYAARYHMRNCYQGYYPAFFINGPFGGNRDKREWADCWLHWNMHASHLGIIKNGDWDLFSAFAEYKMRQIPSAMKLARQEYSCKGIVTQDQQKPDGGNRGFSDDYYKLQIYPCLHTSLLFFQYWQFTQDSTFLSDKLLPYLSMTLQFWKDYLVERDGKLHIPRSHPYEFHNGYAFEDCFTNLSLLKACLKLLPIAEDAANVHTALRDWCLWALERLADFISIPILKDYVTQEKDGKCIYNNPFFFGEEYKDNDEVYAIGFSERVHQYVTHSHTHAEIEEPDVKAHGGYGAFCSSQTAFIYPALLVNSDASPEWGTRMHTPSALQAMWKNGRNALRSIRRYPGAQASAFPVEHEKTLSWTGHSLELPAFAKLGLKEPLRKALKFYTQNYQMFAQGMFNYHPRSRWALACQDYVTEDARDARMYFDRLCRHFSFEELGIFTETIDLMLLDSADGMIRTFPCYDDDALFCLPAQGGFQVEAQQRDKKVEYLRIYSKFGGPCCVRTKWDHCWIWHGTEVREFPIHMSIVHFKTVPGEGYLLSETCNHPNAPELMEHSAAPQRNGFSCLGLFPCL